MTANIPGYTYDTAEAAQSPISTNDFDKMKQAVLFDDNDIRSLNMSHDILKDHVEAMQVI